MYVCMYVCMECERYEYDCLAMKNDMVNGKMKTDCDKK
jgi:hypothetical protein